MATDDAPAEVVTYLEGEIKRLRGELQKATEDYDDALRRQRQHAQDIAALEGVLRFLKDSPAVSCSAAVEAAEEGAD